MSQLFNKIKVGNAKRSTFDLSHTQVTTSDFGYILPICVRHLVPNDDVVVKPDIFVRLSPMAVPTYGRIKARVHHFFVPYRLLYPDWDSFIVSSANLSTSPPWFTVGMLKSLLDVDPQFNTDATPLKNRGKWCKLMSNLGLNPSIIYGLPSTEKISALPFLAYYRIWLDWFMDSNISDHENKVRLFNQMIELGQNLNSYATTFCLTRNCCYKKDYFTTAKLHPQDGDPAKVAVDVASSDLNPGLNLPSSGSSQLYLKSDGTVQRASGGTPSSSVIGQFTVEALRAATALQRYSERSNFVGSKLINRLLAHFGVAPEPERIDMSEFIDGDSFPIQIGDVTSHSFMELDSYYGLGAQAGKGVGAGSTKSVRYHAKEHGIFMSVMSIIPDSGYYQGLNRFWTKGVTGDPLDFYTPEFENLGFQEILNKEVYVPDGDQQVTQYQNYDPDGVFGYTPRFSEYKFAMDVLGSDFVSAGKTPTSQTGFQLDAWHLFRKLVYTENDPLALNKNFTELNNKNNDYDRIFQNTLNYYDHFYFNINCDVKATRPMVGFAEPSLDSTNNQGDGNSINLPYGGTRL